MAKPPTRTVAGAPPRDVVAACYSAFERRDFDALLARLDPEVEWVETVASPDGGTFVGREAVRMHVLDRLVEEWDDFRIEIEEVEEVGPYVTVTGELRGTYKPTGKALAAPFCHIWRVRGGLVVGLRHQNTPGLLDEVR